jgi:hypothetical protein
MQRIKLDAQAEGLYASAFADASKHKLVLVFVNENTTEKPVQFSKVSIASNKKIITYTTSATQNLEKKIVAVKDAVIPAKSIVTVVYEM